MTDVELEDLGREGWFMREGFAPAAGAAIVASGRLDLYGVAAVARDHRSSDVRSDQVRWVEADEVALGPLLAGFEALRVEVNADAWLGLTRFDVQLAHYARGGSGYARHRDTLRGAGFGERRLTAVAYLNPGWTAADGGRLRLHVEPVVEVDPVLGRLVVFLSERVVHEVLPNVAARFAATAWFYGG